MREAWKIHDFKPPKWFRPHMLSFLRYGFASLQKCKFVVLNKQRIQYLVNMIRSLGLFLMQSMVL